MIQLVSHSAPRSLIATSAELLTSNIDNSASSEVGSRSFRQIDSLCEARERTSLSHPNRVYISPFVSYMALAIDRQTDSTISEDTVSEAFERLADSIAIEPLRDSPIAVALYEFLTFTEAYGWQPLFFDIAERLVPALRSQGLATVKQHLQGSGFRYLAYRDSRSELSANE